MNLENKIFKDNSTGEVVKVIGSFENIAILENKQKVDVRKLTDTNYYTEQIDPANFFSNQGAYNSLADKIKSISTENLRDDPSDIAARIGGEVTPSTNESAVMFTSEEDERAELARKYGASVDNVSSTNRQNEAFAKILGEEGAEELPRVQVRNEPPLLVNEPPVQHIEVNREGFREEVQQQLAHRVEVADPIINMFKGVKRNVEFKMNVEISNKIPRLDFIEMMEDSYEISIIDFLADEFTDNLLRNPQQLKTMISDRIKQVVYGGEVRKKEVAPKEEPKKVVKKAAAKKTTKVVPEKPAPPKSRMLKEGKEPVKPKNHQD